MTFPGAVQKDRGQPALVRVGVIETVDPVSVRIQETVIPADRVGVLGSYFPVVGDFVSVAGQSAVGTSGSSWLILGRDAGSSDPPANDTIGVRTAASDVQTVTGGAFTDVLSGAAPVSLNFRKGRADTNLVVHFYASCFAAAPLATVQFGVNINSITDYNTTFFFFNNANVHHAMSSVHLITGAGAGDLTITARWLRGLNNISMDTNDRVSFSVQETT